MGWYPQRGDQVVDRSGTHFVLGDPVAPPGSQGIVYATQAEGAAVKISTNQGSNLRAEDIEYQIRQVARLPIADLPVALPRHTLMEPDVGYTMSLLTGMTSAESLARRPSVETLALWYRETGGLRKRLAVIENLAEILASLHARGLVYGDLSGNNVLVSAHADRARVFLIDLDNLRTADAPSSGFFTPPYGAPEQASSGSSQHTDRFSLAVLAFSVLVAGNPFYGKHLDALPPEDYQRRPYSSVGCWIDDPEDDSNRWDSVMPRALVVSPRMAGLFSRTFCVGKTDPYSRPAAALFASAARSARLAVRRCRSCGWDNFVAVSSCAECGAPSPAEGFALHELTPSGLARFEWCPFLSIDSSGPVAVPAGALGLPGETQEPALVIHAAGSGYEVEVVHPEVTFVGQSRRTRLTVHDGDGFQLARARRAMISLLPLGSTT